MEERLQKILSRCGLCSRRTAEEWIGQGRVTVNGRRALLGQSADLDRDAVEVDGKPVEPPDHLYLMLNKPRGYVTTARDEKAAARCWTCWRACRGGSTRWAAWIWIPKGCCC